LRNRPRIRVAPRPRLWPGLEAQPFGSSAPRLVRGTLLALQHVDVRSGSNVIAVLEQAALPLLARPGEATRFQVDDPEGDPGVEVAMILSERLGQHGLGILVEAHLRVDRPELVLDVEELGGMTERLSVLLRGVDGKAEIPICVAQERVRLRE